jgi:hypothetical protein
MVLEDTACTSDCSEIYFCVAPIIETSSFEKNVSVVDFWWGEFSWKFLISRAGCQVPLLNNNCTSEAFLSSDCYSGNYRVIVTAYLRKHGPTP